MKINKIMRYIQEADIQLAGMQVEESYDFAIDMANNLRKISWYQRKYYEASELEGLTYKEAQDRLGEYLRGNLQKNVERIDSVQ